MVVVAAGGVERGLARRAAEVGVEIDGNGEFGAAGTAEDGWFEPIGLRPRLEAMVGEGIMAVFASVIESAALHFDGDDVERGMVVKAAGLRIEIQAVDFWNGRRHREFRGKRITERERDGARRRRGVDVHRRDRGEDGGATQLAGDVL